jgi:hypothetical protein
MKTNRVITKLILLGMVGFVSNLAKADGPPSGMPQLTDAQRSCMQEKMGSPGSGGRPSREQMESVARECGIAMPSGAPARRPERAPEAPSTASDTRVDPTNVIAGLRSLRGEDNDYVRLDGRIPRVCREKISVSMTCPEQNRVAFTVGEIARDGFQCLKDNQNKCREDAPSSDCISMDDLSRDSQEFILKLSNSFLQFWDL